MNFGVAKKRNEANAISVGDSHVAGAEVETTSVWTGFRRQREKPEHLVVIHYSLRMPPPEKTIKCFPDL